MSLGPVILAEDQEPQICIFFPSIPVLADGQHPQRTVDGVWMGRPGNKLCAK